MSDTTLFIMAVSLSAIHLDEKHVQSLVDLTTKIIKPKSTRSKQLFSLSSGYQRRDLRAILSQASLRQIESSDLSTVALFLES